MISGHILAKVQKEKQQKKKNILQLGKVVQKIK
jgi:hypothetical protein